MEVLKDEISQVMIKNNEVWLIECDELKNFKFYFSAYNASTLLYLQKKTTSKSLFSWNFNILLKDYDISCFPDAL